MFWLIVYHLLRGNGRPACETQQPAEPADEPATTATKSAPSDAVTSAHTVRHDMSDIVLITDDTTHADLILALGYLNDTAKAVRRKGYTGTASAAYARQHARIDALLTELEATP